LYNFDPPATDEEIAASALQYVRKISGYRKPSKLNKPAFETAVREISNVTRQLMDSLQTSSPPRNREIETIKAKAKAQKRFDDNPNLQAS